MLQRCPNLRKVVIRLAISEMKAHEMCKDVPVLQPIKLMMRYMHVDVRFIYK